MDYFVLVLVLGLVLVLIFVTSVMESVGKAIFWSAICRISLDGASNSMRAFFMSALDSGSQQ